MFSCTLAKAAFLEFLNEMNGHITYVMPHIDSEALAISEIKLTKTTNLR